LCVEASKLHVEVGKGVTSEEMCYSFTLYYPKVGTAIWSGCGIAYRLYCFEQPP